MKLGLSQSDLQVNKEFVLIDSNWRREGGVSHITSGGVPFK